MKLISEVEPSARGVYTGAIGCFNGPSAYELNIAIRTAIVSDGQVRFQVGAGIVADSNPEMEYEETLAKAGGFETALSFTETPAPSARRNRIF